MSPLHARDAALRVEEHDCQLGAMSIVVYLILDMVCPCETHDCFTSH